MIAIRQRLAALSPHAPVLLVFAALVLLPISRLVELPLVVMAVLGGRRLWLEGAAVLSDWRVRVLTGVFLAYWIPIVISAPDSVHPEKTWVMVAAMPRYWLAGLFAMSALRTAASHARLWQLTAWLLVFWTVDALIQAAFGYDLLGHPYPVEPIERVNGVFGLNNFKLGPMLALFSPLLIEHARRYWPSWGLVLAVFGLATVVLLTTTRSGWVMLGVVAVIYVWHLGRQRPLRTLLASGIVVATLLSTAAVAYQASEPFRERVDDTLVVFDGTRGALDHALSARLPIWETSVAMARDHWINGVGARGYRYIYPEYADANDPWVREDEGIGATYAHHMGLEIWSETGVVGLAGFTVLIAIIVLSWRRTPPERRDLLFPYGLALFVAVFPFNSHYAVYSTFWSITLWWLVMGYCAAAGDE